MPSAPAARAAAAAGSPLTRTAAGPAAADAGATAMCDTSDGLLADAGHLAADSGVVLALDRSALRAGFVVGPLPQVAAALGADPLAWVLTGGEDHALVATFPPGVELPAGWTTIGSVQESDDGGPGVRVDGVPAAEVAAELGEGTGHVHFG